MSHVLEYARDLVAIPSVNPMGGESSGEEYFEHRLTDYLQNFAQSHGLQWLRQPIAPLRDNFLTVIPGSQEPTQGGKLLLLEAHQDTVPVSGMTIDPWRPVVKNGRLHGRGACDIKGGMATLLAVLERLIREQPAIRPTVVLACTVNEEYGFTGAKGLVELWTKTRPDVLPRCPDAVIVTEPTELNIVVAHRGVVRWRVKTTGRAAHSSLPELGDNAIYRMGPILWALKRYQHDVVPTLGQHPLCGRPSLSAGTIHGGVSVNTVPDECVLELDRRILPGDDPLAAYQQVVEWITRQAFDPGHVLHEPPFMQSAGLSDKINGPLARGLAATVQRTLRAKPQIQGVSYGTDAAAFGHLVPTVVFGPGSIAQAHTADEWVSVDQLDLASEIVYQFVRDFGS
ncbi:MAG: M20 family metallopeptidase [Pirellulales bacterium]|nr:M20 family metallopeptidase [Pirellulales bacterium]